MAFETINPLLFCLFIIILIIIYYYKLRDKVSERKTKSRMSFRESMNLTELPIVTFYSGSNKLNFLLDTGANMSAINSKDLQDLEYTKLNKKGTVHGIEGHLTETEYVSIDFTYNDKLYASVFQVVDLQEAFDKIKQESGVTIHGILGSKFFEEYKYILNFKSCTAYTGK